MKKRVLKLVDTLYPAGAETLAVSIAVMLSKSDRYEPVVCSTRTGGALESVLREREIPYHIIERSTRLSPYKMRQVAGIMRRERIDIIHSHKVGPNVWASLLGRARGVPSIATVHGGGEYLWWYGLTERVVLKLATRVIAVSDYERRRLLRFSIAGNRVVTVPNGIDIARFNHPSRADIRRSLGIPEDVPVVGICAALRPEKNHEMFLEAAGRLIADGSDAWFLVVGGGQRLDLLKEKAAALGIGGRCRFTGAVDDVPDYMSAFDVGVLSSDREGLPLAILEYMASSLPVVATDIAAVSEAVRQDETGFLVPPGDVGALAGAVGRLVADPDLRARLGARGRALCEERFSLEAMMDGVTAQYDSVLENP